MCQSQRAARMADALKLSNLDDDALSMILRHSNEPDISSLSKTQKKWRKLGQTKLQGKVGECLVKHSLHSQEVGDTHCRRRWDYTPEIIRRAVVCCLDMRARPFVDINPPHPRPLHLYVHASQLVQFNADDIVKCLAKAGFPLELTLLYPPPRTDIPNTLPKAAGMTPHRALVVAEASGEGLAGDNDDVDTVRFSGECTEIQEDAFRDNHSLIELPPQMPQLKMIGSSAFQNCTELQTLPESLPELTQIGNSAFLGCKQLRRLPNMENLEAIGMAAFRECTQLQLPETLPRLEYIGGLAFPVDLKTLPESLPELVTIANNGLNGCKDLKTLPKMPKLKTIGDEALMNCFNLSMLPEMDQLETIGFQALANCYKLRRVHLPKTLRTVEKGAFFKCPLETVNIAPGARFRCKDPYLLEVIRGLDMVTVDGILVTTPT